MYLNKAIIIGNLTRDPELKALPSGSKVVNFSVATNRTWKDKDGAKQEDVEFHSVVAFGRTAELVAQYLKKGSQALVEGRIQTRSWEGKDGEKKYRTEVVAESVQFGSRPAGSRQENAAGSAPGVPVVDVSDQGDGEINPDDIPF